MLVIFTRTLILYIVVVIAMRIMGKRQIGQLQPFELVIAIMVSELASVPMQNTEIPLLYGIVPILTLLASQLLLSLISLKSLKLRRVICGKPGILIKNGKIDEKALEKELYTVNDLLEQLRIKGFANISDVEFALLETNGQLSIISKSQKRPVNPQDLNINTRYEGLSSDIIADGKILNNNLRAAGLDINWLNTKLSDMNISKASEVIYAGLDTEGNLYIQKKNDQEFA